MNAKPQLALAIVGIFLGACSSEVPPRTLTGGAGGGIGPTGTGTAGGIIGATGGSIIGTGNPPANGEDVNPKTCTEAASAHTYVGCEFWPTVTANPVYVEFDPAVVVTNGQTEDAKVVIDGPNAFHQEVTIKPGELQTILLKWVMGLKGPEFALANTATGRLTSSARVDKGAYRMTSSVPVTAWQFNPLQYRKPATACPRVMFGAGATECRSSTVDASLLLPTTAMTGNYRVFG